MDSYARCRCCGNKIKVTTNRIYCVRCAKHINYVTSKESQRVNYQNKEIREKLAMVRKLKMVD